MERISFYQVLLEPQQHHALREIARQEKRSLSEIIRKMVDKQMAERKWMALAAWAQSLLADYQADPELFAISFLDKDEFLLLMEKPGK